MTNGRPEAVSRWWIGDCCSLSTVINYIDRQTLSVLGPTLKAEYHWTNSDFALVIIAFRVAYTIGQTRRRHGFSIASARAPGLTHDGGVLLRRRDADVAGDRIAVASASFVSCSALGEAGNWPGATKAVSEWFPRRESGWAVALFDSGSSIGARDRAAAGARAALTSFGTWRPAFIVTGALGLLWLLLFRWLYHPPETHPRISRRGTRRTSWRTARRARRRPQPAHRRSSYGTLLRLPQTWGIVIGKALTDPVWFFITDWFAIYLVSRGFSLEDSLLAFWVPFLAADARQLRSAAGSRAT